MNYLDKFSIQFTSLKPGEYNFKFMVDDAFFEKFDESEIKQGSVKVTVDLQRHERMLVLDFSLQGKVNIMCDRCLDYFDFDLNSTEKLIVKFGTVKNEETDEIITIPVSDYEINIARYIYEFVHLALPIKRVQSDDENGVTKCDKEIIKKLEELKNKESKEEDTDPRWDVLKKINFK